MTALLVDVKMRSDDEYRALYSLLDAQVVELQEALKGIEAEVNAMQPGTYALRVAVRIDALKAKGDAAYERLRAASKC